MRSTHISKSLSRSLLACTVLFLGASARTQQAADNAPWVGTGLSETVERAAQILRHPTAETARPDWVAAPAPRDRNVELMLREMAEAEDPALRVRALEAWREFDAAAAMERLVQALADPDPAVRETAARDLARGDTALLAGYLLSTFTSEDAAARGALAQALPLIKTEGLTALLLDVYQQEGETVLRRCAAAYCLGRMGAAEAAPVLARGAWAADPSLAYTSADALHTLRDPRMVQAWSQLLSHNESSIRALAVDALATLGGDAAFAALMGLAKNTQEPNLELRKEALKRMCDWPMAYAVPRVAGILADTPDMKPIVARALRNRTGQDFGEDPEVWQRWWQSGEWRSQKPEEKTESPEALEKPQRRLYDIEYLGEPPATPPEETPPEETPQKETPPK